MTATANTVAASSLFAFTRSVFSACGLSRRHASEAAAALHYADLAGLDGHGVANLDRIYVQGIRNGRIDPEGEPRFVREHAATGTLEANRALGLIVGAQAMDAAIARAHDYGVGAIAVRGSSHLGAAGYYAMRAADAGMIGIVTTNLGAERIVRPPDGSSALLGTNPFSAAAPAAANTPFLLDMSTTVVPTGRLRAEHRRGAQIPRGWLVDDDGAPVRDPGAYDAGTGHLLWLGSSSDTGAYKGYGLAILVEILSAVLSGADVGPRGNRAQSTDGESIGHFFLALDVGAFRERHAFLADMDSVLTALRSCPSAVPEGVKYPGLPESETAARRREQGIPLDRDLLGSLERLADQLDITPLGALG